MAANSTNQSGTQPEMQRVEKVQEAQYLENLQTQGYEHVGEPLQYEMNTGIDEIRSSVMVHAMQMNANLITEVENPSTVPGQPGILVYYLWKTPQAQVPQADPQPFACPYCTQPFMAIPAAQTQVVACPSCGGANIIPALETPPATPSATPEPPPAPAPTPSATPEPAPTPAPAATPEPAPTPAPAATPEPAPSPTPAPAPAATPEPAPTPAPAATPEPAPTPAPAPVPAATPAQAPAATVATPETSTETIEYQEYNPQSDQDYSQTSSQQYSTDYPSFDYFTKKVETNVTKPQTPLLTPEYEQSYTSTFTSTEQAIKLNMQKLADLLANPDNSIKFYDSGELMYPKVTIRKSAYTHLTTREMDLLLIKDGVNDYKIIANESHGQTGGNITPMQDELFSLKTLGHSTYRAMEDWAYLDEEQKTSVSKCIFAFADIYLKKLSKTEVPTN